MKEGTEIPKAYGDAGKFTNSQWHAAERKEMTGILDHESRQEIEQSLATAEMRKKALRAHHFYDLKKRSTDANNRAHNPYEPMPSEAFWSVALNSAPGYMGPYGADFA